MGHIVVVEKAIVCKQDRLQVSVVVVIMAEIVVESSQEHSTSLVQNIAVTVMED